MSFLFKTVLIAALSYVGELFFPWWIVVISAFLGGALVHSRGINSFLSGFLGVGLLWLIYAWVLDLRAESIISTQVAPLFSMEEPAFLILATALLGAIMGGLGALSGDLFIKSFPKREKNKYYG
jgi:MFS-type transporter involved in bile tolerance (Atg22 family)